MELKTQDRATTSILDIFSSLVEEEKNGLPKMLWIMRIFLLKGTSIHLQNRLLTAGRAVTNFVTNAKNDTENLLVVFFSPLVI